MRIDIVTLFPELCQQLSSPAGIPGRARARTCSRRTVTRSATIQKTSRSRPMTTPTAAAAAWCCTHSPSPTACGCAGPVRRAGGRAKPHVVFLTAAGRQPTMRRKARELASYDAVTLVCGHYEGIDQRVIDAFGDEEISIGDYVLTGGELASLVVADSVLRLQPGVLAEEKKAIRMRKLLGRPAAGISPSLPAPEVWGRTRCAAGAADRRPQKIDEWRGAQSRERTRERRPTCMTPGARATR